MRLRLWLSPGAKAQIVREDVWWQTNRTKAPNAFWEDPRCQSESRHKWPSEAPLWGFELIGVNRSLREKGILLM